MKKEENTTPDIQDENAYIPTKLVEQIDKFFEYRRSEEARLEKLCDSWAFKNSKQLEYSEICRKAIKEVEEKGYKTLLDAQKEIKSLDERLKLAVQIMEQAESPEGIKISAYMKLLVQMSAGANKITELGANLEEAHVLVDRTLKKNEELTLSNDELNLENKELMAEVEELRLLNAGLRDRVTAQRNKKKEFRSQAKSLLISNAELEAAYVKEEQKVMELSNQLNDAKQVGDLSDRLDCRVREVNQLREEVTNLKDTITGKNLKLDALQEDVKLLHRVVNEHGIKPWKERYDEMKESKAKAEENHKLWISRSNTTIRTLRAEVKEWKDKYNDLAKLKDESLIQLQGQIQELNTSLEKAQSDATFFQDELTVAREDNAQLNRDFAAYKSAYALRLNEKADLEVQVADLKSKLRLPKSNLVEVEKKDLGKELADNRRLREQLDEAKSTISYKEGQIIALRNELKAATDTCNSYRLDKVELKEVKTKLEEQVEALQKQLKIKTVEWLEQTKLVVKLQEASEGDEESWQSLYESEMADNSNLRAQVKSLTNKIAIWERSWADQEKETTEWKKKSNEFNLKMCAALKERNDLAEEVKHGNSANAISLEEIARLRKQVEELKAELDMNGDDRFTVLLVEL